MATALPICSVSDFTGLYDLGLNSGQETEFELLIPEYEKVLIRTIFSDEMFIDLAAASSLENPYKDLISGVNYTNADSKLTMLTGFKSFMVKMIYYDYRKELHYSNKTMHANDNTVLNSAENVSTKLNAVWNAAIKEYLNEIVPFWELKKSEAGFEKYLDFNMPVLRATSIF